MELWDILDEGRGCTGRLAQRGEPIGPDEYHLVVDVWITNGRGDFLISKRTPNKTFPGMWETTGGSVIAGEGTLEGALREVAEELGVCLDPQRGRLTQLGRASADTHYDVWLFAQDVDISRIVPQPDEVSVAKWATKQEVRDMVASGEFVNVYTYLDELFRSVPDGSSHTP